MQDFRLSLWEILVPVFLSNNVVIDIEFHKEWDEQVRSIASGLTIMPVARGPWINARGELFSGRMIPMQVVCTTVELRYILKMTRKHYDLEAVLCYLISDVILIEKGDD